MDAINFYKSKWPVIRANSAMFTGFLLGNLPRESRKAINVDHVCGCESLGFWFFYWFLYFKKYDFFFFQLWQPSWKTKIPRCAPRWPRQWDCSMTTKTKQKSKLCFCPRKIEGKKKKNRRTFFVSSPSLFCPRISSLWLEGEIFFFPQCCVWIQWLLQQVRCLCKKQKEEKERKSLSCLISFFWL